MRPFILLHFILFYCGRRQPSKNLNVLNVSECRQPFNPFRSLLALRSIQHIQSLKYQKEQGMEWNECLECNGIPQRRRLRGMQSFLFNFKMKLKLNECLLLASHKRKMKRIAGCGALAALNLKFKLNLKFHEALRCGLPALPLNLLCSIHFTNQILLFVRSRLANCLAFI